MGAGAEAALAVVLRLRNQMQDELGGVRSQLQAFARDAAMVGGALTAGVSVPLLAIARDALNVASTFESQMNVLTVAARSSGTSMEELSRAALLVGKDTQLVGINSQEAADAMTNFYKAGLSTSDIFGGKLNNYLAEGTNLTGALRSAIDLAAASELDLSAASMLVASSMATFGLDATDAGRIANAFVGAADASLASVNDLALAMQNIGPTAAAFGWSLEETNTALAILSTRGIMGAEAGTALKSMMTNLMSGTKDVTAALSALNVSLYDQQGNMLPLPAIIGQLQTAMAGMTEEQRNSTVQTLAGTFGMKALNTLLAEGTTGWDAMATAVANAATAQEVGAARTQGLQAAWEQMRGAIETVYIQVGLPLIQNFLTPLVQRITEVISSIMTMNPQVLNAALAFAGVLAVAGPVLLAVSGIAAVLGALLGPIGLVVLGVAALAAAWTTDFGGIASIVGPVVDAMISVFQMWYTATGSVTQAIQGMLGGLALMVPGLQPVIGVLSELVSWLSTTIPFALNTLQSMWGAAWPVISGALATALGIIGPLIGQITGWLQTDLPMTLNWLSTIWQATWRTIGGVLTTVLPIIGGFVTGVVGAFTESWPKIVNIVSGVFLTLNSIISTVVAAVGPIVSDFVLGAVGVFQRVWPQILAVVQSVVNAVQSVVFAVLGVVKTFMASHGEEIKSFIGNAWKAIQGIVETALGIIQASVVPALAGIAGFIQAHGKEIQTVLNGAWQVIKTVITTALGVIQGVLSTVLAALRGDWSGAWTAMRGVASTLWEGIKGIISGALTVILGLVGTNLAEVKAWFVNIFNEVKAFLGGIDLGAIGSAMITGLIAGIRSMAGALVAAARGVVQSAVDAAKALLGIHSPSTVFWEMGQNTDTGYAGGVEEKQSVVVAAVSTMAQAAVGAARELSAAFGDAGTSAVAQMAAGMEKKSPAVSEAATAVMAQATGAVSGALELLNGLATEVRIPDVGDAINRVSRFLTTLVGNLAAWAETVSGEAQAAAQKFAESAGPVVDAYSGALELLTALASETRVPNAGEGINRVSRFLTTLVGNLAEWAKTVGADAQAAAKAFAENAKPVESAYTDALKLLEALAEETRVPNAGEGINRVSRFLTTLVGNLAAWAETVSWQAVRQAQAFAQSAGDVLKLFGDALSELAKLAGVDFASLTESAYQAGFGWVTGLADGIRGGMDYLVAALAAVGDLFPHSPAKTGPLRRAPDWAAYLNFGLIDAATQVAGVLSGVGGGMTVAPAAISRQSSVTPARSRSGAGYAPAVINFTYAPAVSLASEREAQEVIAPMLRTVMAREGRR